MIDFDDSVNFVVDREEEREEIANIMIAIRVIGVGGAGCNAIDNMLRNKITGADFMVVNTDLQSLGRSIAREKIQIGIKSTKGLGTGFNPELGRRAAEEDLEKIMGRLGDSDMVFLTAGLGGGTGSGALPVIAAALKDKGILSVAIVTKPFNFEGKQRSLIADEALKELTNVVDTLIVIPNQRLLEITDRSVSMIDAFALVNEVLEQSVRSISDIITKPGHINVDFADVRTIMREKGLAVMGIGRASGEDRAREAATKAVSSPLLENASMEGAQSILMNITGPSSIALHEINDAAEAIHEQTGDEASIILGSAIDETLGDEIVVTVIATGFPEARVEAQRIGDEKRLYRTGIIVGRRAESEAHFGGGGKIQDEVSRDSDLGARRDEDELDVPAFMREGSKEDSAD